MQKVKFEILNANMVAKKGATDGMEVDLILTNFNVTVRLHMHNRRSIKFSPQWRHHNSCYK